MEMWEEIRGPASTAALKQGRMFEEASEPEVVGGLQTNPCIACSEVGNGVEKCLQTMQTELPILRLFKEKWEAFAELGRAVTSPDLHAASSH